MANLALYIYRPLCQSEDYHQRQDNVSVEDVY